MSRRRLVAGLLLGLLLPSPAPAQALPGFQVFELTAATWDDAAVLVERAALHPAGLLVIGADAPHGGLPVAVPPRLRVLDLRHGEGISLVRGDHNRLRGRWQQYGGLRTGLRQNLILSDVITPDAQTYDWQSQPQPYSPARPDDPAAYADSHNHYQNLLSEVWNFNSHINGVAIWGDSAAMAQDGKSWGGFFSARSWPANGAIVPAGRGPVDPARFDAQLVGIEIDVLNAGQPADAAGAQSKTGLQVVGFGRTNAQAIEIRSEDTDSPDWANRRGRWTTAMMINRALDPESGRVVWGLFEHGRAGIDFDLPLFRAGALRFRSEAPGQGVVINGGRGGQIYAAADQVMTVGGGAGGLRLTAADGRPVLGVDGAGAVTVFAPDGRAAFGVAADGSLTAGRRSLAVALARDLLHRHPLAVAAALGGGVLALLLLQAAVALWVVRRLGRGQAAGGKASA